MPHNLSKAYDTVALVFVTLAVTVYLFCPVSVWHWHFTHISPAIIVKTDKSHGEMHNRWCHYFLCPQHRQKYNPVILKIFVYFMYLNTFSKVIAIYFFIILYTTSFHHAFDEYASSGFRKKKEKKPTIFLLLLIFSSGLCFWPIVYFCSELISRMRTSNSKISFIRRKQKFLIVVKISIFIKLCEF